MSISFIAGSLLLAGVAQSVYSAEWYFRPAVSGPYGSGDGTSYDNAWHLNASTKTRGAIDWSFVRPGDTLFVCGTHDGGYRDNSLRPILSGEPGQEIIIDGACPILPGAQCGDMGAESPDCDPGVMFAAGYRLLGRNQWQQVEGSAGADGGSVYYRRNSGCTRAQVFEGTELRLNRVHDSPTDPNVPAIAWSEWPAGSFWQPATACSLPSDDPMYRILFYKPSVGITAGDRAVYTAHGSPILFLRSLDYYRVRNLSLRNAATSNGMIQVSDSDQVSIEGNELRWAANIAIAIQSGSDNGQIVGNTIHDSANGIYFLSSRDSDNSNSWIISRNEIYDIDQEFYYGDRDSHGLGIQGGSSHRINRNHIHHGGGSGITFYTFPAQTQSQNIVEYNFVHDIYDIGGGGRNERGIEHGSSNQDVPSATLGNIVRYNIIAHTGGIGLRVKSRRSPTESATWSLLNNVVYNAGVSFAWSEYSSAQEVTPPGFLLQNNIFMNPVSGRHLQQDGHMGFDLQGIEMSHNLYFPDGEPGSESFGWQNLRFDSLAQWQAVSGQGRASMVSDPQLENPVGGDFLWSGNPGVIRGYGSFMPLGSSPAVDAGAAELQGLDIRGQPSVDIIDVGAYEVVVEPDEPPEDGDGDGVPDSADQCPGTAIPEAVPTRRLRSGRYALTGEPDAFTFESSGSRITTADTAGCSCDQIIDALGGGQSVRRYGCPERIMQRWMQRLR